MSASNNDYDAFRPRPRLESDSDLSSLNYTIPTPAHYVEEELFTTDESGNFGNDESLVAKPDSVAAVPTDQAVRSPLPSQTARQGSISDDNAVALQQPEPTSSAATVHLFQDSSSASTGPQEAVLSPALLRNTPNSSADSKNPTNSNANVTGTGAERGFHDSGIQTPVPVAFSTPIAGYSSRPYASLDESTVQSSSLSFPPVENKSSRGTTPSLVSSMANISSGFNDALVSQPTPMPTSSGRSSSGPVSISSNSDLIPEGNVMSPEQDQLLMKGDPEIHVVEKEDPASSRRVLAKKAQKPNRRMKDVVAIAFVEEGELQQGESPPRRPTKRERMEDVGCHWPLRQLPKMPRSAALIEPDKFKNVAEKMLGKKNPHLSFSTEASKVLQNGFESFMLTLFREAPRNHQGDVETLDLDLFRIRHQQANQEAAAQEQLQQEAANGTATESDDTADEMTEA